MKKSAEPDPSKINEQYAKMYETMMAEAMKQMDAVTRQAEKAHAEALDELAAAREEKKRIEHSAAAIAEAYVEKHRQKLEDEINKKTLLSVVKALLHAGRSGTEIQEWLAVPTSMLETARMHLGFRKLGAQDARVTYEQQGRGGTVVFQRETLQLRFDWEFGGGDAIALVFVPAEAHWQAQTGLPTEERLPILDFVGRQILADQGGARYELSGDVLTILKS